MSSRTLLFNHSLLYSPLTLFFSVPFEHFLPTLAVAPYEQPQRNAASQLFTLALCPNTKYERVLDRSVPSPVCLSIFIGNFRFTRYCLGETDGDSQLEVRAACRYAMEWRRLNELEGLRTMWEDVLVEMKQLREDFKRQARRKKIFSCKVAKPCSDQARHLLQRIHSRYGTVSSNPLYEMLPSGPIIPVWAKEDYLALRARLPPEDDGPEPSSDSEEASDLDLAPDLRQRSPQRRPGKQKRKCSSASPKDLSTSNG